MARNPVDGTDQKPLIYLDVSPSLTCAVARRFLLAGADPAQQLS